MYWTSLLASNGQEKFILRNYGSFGHGLAETNKGQTVNQRRLVDAFKKQWIWFLPLDRQGNFAGKIYWGSIGRKALRKNRLNTDYCYTRPCWGPGEIWAFSYQVTQGEAGTPICILLWCLKGMDARGRNWSYYLGKMVAWWMQDCTNLAFYAGRTLGHMHFVIWMIALELLPIPDEMFLTRMGKNQFLINWRPGKIDFARRLISGLKWGFFGSAQMLKV